MACRGDRRPPSAGYGHRPTSGSGAFSITNGSASDNDAVCIHVNRAGCTLSTRVGRTEVAAQKRSSSKLCVPFVSRCV